MEGKGPSPLPGFAILGCFAVAVVGVVHAFLYEDGSGLIASAIAFGAVTMASFK